MILRFLFIAERIFTNYNYNSNSTRFLSVRYGNVIASRGSFIPLWMDLIKENKCINVTSLECSRFLFTLDDAVDTVLNSIIHSLGGEVFIPKLDIYIISNTNNKKININILKKNLYICLIQATL